MINLVVGMPDQASSASSAPCNQQSSALSSQSFESELSEAISDVFSKFGIDPKSVQVTVGGSTGQNNAASQDSATVEQASQSAPTQSMPPQSAPEAASQSANDVYWAKQPKAVQQLRNIQDTGQRSLLATQLASQGYSIDVPVMVWGWDAGITTQLRQSYGYTWVPSALQQPIPEAPGINNPGGTPYDAAHPPAGSIKV